MHRRVPAYHNHRKLPRPLKLYWLSTPDHDEDAFVVATRAGVAQRAHEEHQGYSRGTSTAELIGELTAEWQSFELLYASRELLRAMGAEFPAARVVKLGGKAYAIGDVDQSVRIESGEEPVH